MRETIKAVLKKMLIVFLAIFLLVVVVYLFRKQLFSDTICEQIAKAIQDNSGIVVTIEEFSGSYFFGVIVKNIKLQDGADLLSDLSVDEISASYNPFAILWGGRIVDNITVKNPKVIVTNLPPPTKKETPAKSDSEPVNIDLDFILTQVPDVYIQNVSFALNTPQQQLEVSGLNFTNIQNDCKIQIERIAVEDKAAEISQALSDFLIAFKITNKIFTLQQIKVTSDTYKESIDIQQLVTLDLNYFDKLPLTFSLPTPGGIINGAAALASDQYIKIEHSEIDFEKTLQLLSKFQNKQIATTSGKLAFSADLKLPQWNPNNLNGTTTLDIFRTAPKKWHNKKKNGLTSYVYIEDFSLLEKLANSVVEIEPVDVGGSLSLANSLVLKKDKIALSGQIKESKVKTRFFPYQDITGRWDVNYDLKQQVCDIANTHLSLGSLKAQISSYLDLAQNKESSVDVKISLADLRKYANLFIAEEQRDQFDANVDISINATGMLPRVDSQKKEANFRGQLKCHLNDLIAVGKDLGNIHFEIKFHLTNENVHIPSIVGIWNGKKFLQLELKSGIKPGSEVTAQGEYRFHDLPQKLQEFVPDITKLFVGKIRGKINVNGKVPSSSQDLDITATHNLSLTNGKLLNKLPFNSISVPITVTVKPQTVTINNCRIKWNDNTLLKVDGNFGYQPQETSDIRCRILVKEPLQQFAAILPPDMPQDINLHKVFIDTRVSGKLLQLGADSPLSLSTNIRISDIKAQDIHIKQLKLQTALKSNLAELAIDKFQIQGDDYLNFKILPSLIKFKDQTFVKIKGRTKISKINQLVSLPDVTIGNISNMFHLYLDWPSVSAIPSTAVDTISDLVQKPQDLLSNFQKHATVKCQLFIASTAGKINKFNYQNIKYQLSASFAKGKFSLKKSDVTVNNNTIVKTRGYISPKSNNAITNNNSLLADIPAYGYIQGQKFNFQTDITVTKIQDYLQKFMPSPPPVAGDLALNISLASKHNTEAVKAMCNITLGNGKLDKLSFGSITFKNNFFCDLQKKVNMTSNLQLDGKQLIKIIGKANAQDFNGSLNTTVTIDTVEKYLQPFINESPFSGNVLMNFNVQASSPNKSFDIQNIKLNTNYNLQCSNGKILQYSYDNITFSKDISLKENSININKMFLSLDGERLVTVFGNADLQPLNADITTHVTLNDLKKLTTQFLPQQKNIEGALFFGLKISGNSQQGIQQTPLSLEQGSIKCLLKLENFVFDQQQFPHINLDTAILAQHDKITIDKCKVSYGDISLLNVHGNSGYKPQSPFNLTLESNIEEIINRFGTIALNRKSPILYGDSILTFNAQGHIPSPQNSLDVATALRIPFAAKKGQKQWRIDLGEIVFSGKKEAVEQGVTWKTNVSGTQQQPQIDTTFVYNQDLVRVPASNTRVDNIAVNSKLTHRKFTTTIACLIGGGKLDINIAVELDDKYFPKNLDVKITGKRILLIRNDMLYGRADLDITLNGDIIKNKNGQPQLRGKLDGKIDITEFKVTAKMSIEAVLQSSPERASGNSHLGFDSPFVDLDLNLHVKISQVAIYNELARIKTKGDIWVKGNTANPKISGWIGTTSGKLFLPQGNMNITECIIQLSPNRPLIPQLNIIAETTIREYTVFVNIQGTPGDMSIEFTSSPSLPKEDILTLLLTGGTRSELSESGGQRLQDTGSSILMQQILNAIGVGGFISAQVSPTSAAVTITPESWGGFGVQAKIEEQGNPGLNFLYRIKFK